MNRPLLLVLAMLVLGAAPAPLVVGSVRDQQGAPVAGATVRLTGSTASTRTAADGTFAMQGAGATVEIRCDYCRPTTAPVGADGTVTAIVQRYDAVRSEGPSHADMANLPYTHAESNVSLTPWVVLEQNNNPFAASSLHDRSISTVGGLLVLDGVPDYNSADGAQTYTTIPYNSAADVDVERVPQAYEYGNIANFGTFAVTTTGGAPLVGAGSSAIGGISVNGPTSATVGISSDASGARSRGTALVTTPLSNSTLQVTLASGSGEDSNSNHQSLQSSFSSFRLAYERTSGADLYASVTGDRGTDGYATPGAFFGLPTQVNVNDLWSDFDGRIGVRSHAIIAPFAEADVHTSTGWYEAPGLDEYTGQIADQYTQGTIDQLGGYAGVNATLPWLTANAAYGTEGIKLVSTYPEQTTTTNTGHDASATLDLHPAASWDLQGSASSGYLLPTVLGYSNSSELGYPPFSAISSDELTLTYNDLKRIRVGLTSFGTRNASGTVDDTSAGALVAWQIAPAISLRTWWLEVHPRTGSAQSVGSAWLTAASGTIRVDVIWRRDLYDFAGNAHLDGAISGPFGVRARWFAQTEQFAHTRMTNVGIRF